MKIIDSIKAFLSQEIVLRPKAATVPIGGYEGSNRYSTDRSYIYDNAPEFGEEDSFARAELLSLSRYAVRNFPVCEKILTSISNYTVGAGITLQAATADSSFNTGATSYFDGWAISPFSTVNNDLNFYDLQKLTVRELIVAGEIFFVLTKSETGFPQLIAVCSEQVRHSGKKEDKSIDGIFYNEQGKAVAYNIIFAGDKPTRVDAGNVVHIKITKNVNQRRGVSAFASSLNSLRDLYDIHNLVKKAHKAHSALAVAVTRKAGNSDNGVFQNKLPQRPGTCPPANTGPNNRLEKAFGGAVAYLNEGESIDLLSSESPSEPYFKHLQTLLNEVCMSIGLNYSFLIDPSALTSAGTRFVIADSDTFFKNLQDLIVYSGIQRIYTWVVASGIKDGKLQKSTDESYWKANYVFPASITIDRGREDRTTLEFVANGLMSLDSYYASRGKNYRDELNQIAQEKQYIAELEAKYGVKLSANPQPAPAVEPAAPKDTEEEDAKE